MADGDEVTAAVVAIGDEVLSGRTQDTNTNTLARWFTAKGVRLKEARVVGDDKAAIGGAVNALRRAYRYVVTTGGIGPTHDDITADAVADAFGVALELHPEAVRRLRGYLGEDRLNEARLRMARIPAGASLIDNPVSIAPGFQIENVFVLAGVPKVMEGMLTALDARIGGGAPTHSASWRCGIPEGDLGGPLARLQADYP
ncbi:MAG: competence/damage-inducible protein A, partial [Pseudomonadota bacterium]